MELPSHGDYGTFIGGLLVGAIITVAQGDDGRKRKRILLAYAALTIVAIIAWKVNTILVDGKNAFILQYWEPLRPRVLSYCFMAIWPLTTWSVVSLLKKRYARAISDKQAALDGEFATKQKALAEERAKAVAEERAWNVNPLRFLSEWTCAICVNVGTYEITPRIQFRNNHSAQRRVWISATLAVFTNDDLNKPTHVMPMPVIEVDALPGVLTDAATSVAMSAAQAHAILEMFERRNQPQIKLINVKLTLPVDMTESPRLTTKQLSPISVRTESVYEHHRPVYIAV